MDYLLLAILLLLQIADIATTVLVLDGGGKELNPVVAFFLKRLGVLRGLVVIKLILLVPLCVCVYLHIVPLWALAALIALYIWVVSHNIQELN